MMVDESQRHILVMVIPPSMTEILAMGSYKPLLLGRGVEPLLGGTQWAFRLRPNRTNMLNVRVRKMFFFTLPQYLPGLPRWEYHPRNLTLKSKKKCCLSKFYLRLQIWRHFSGTSSPSFSPGNFLLPGF